MTQDTEHTLQKARQLVETGQHDNARQCLLQLLKQQPDNRVALIMLGGAYFSMQKYSEAELVYKRLILMEPGNGRFSIALFNTLWKSSRHDEALEEIKRFMAYADKAAEQETIKQYLAIIEEFAG